MIVEWEGGRVADMVADAVIAVLLKETGDVEGRVATADAAWQAARRCMLVHVFCVGVGVGVGVCI